MPTKLLRLPEVRARVPFSKAQIYLLISRGDFPKPISLGVRAVAWSEDAIAAWIASREQASKPREGDK